MNHPLPQLPARLAESHKGDYGRVLLIGGSRGMSGAIALAGMAALNGGAGLVRLATADECVATVAGFNPAYMTLPLPSDRAGRIGRAALDPLLEACAAADVVALGPGLGRSLGLGVIVERLFRDVAAPMVVDADALNELAERQVPLERYAGPRILTPHPGEFGRLVPTSAGSDRAAMERATEKFAADRELVVVLKGHHTLVADGRQAYRNATGNPGMATGGIGDVLTGVIAALLGQKLAPFAAAQLGVYLHGMAGDLAAEDVGETSLTPSDLIDFLPDAFQIHVVVPGKS